MPSSIDEQVSVGPYAPGTPLTTRLKAKARDKTWNLLTNVGGPIINYGWTTGAGLATGSYLGYPLTGVVVGTALRLTPWAIRKYAIQPWYHIPKGMRGIVLDNERVFKESASQVALSLLEQTRKDMESRGEEGIAEEAFYKYQNNKNDFFMPKAKVVGPGWHYKLPGTTYVAAEEDAYTVNPPPRTFLALTRQGVKIEINVDPALSYKKLLIPFAIKYHGKLGRKDPNWEQDLNNHLALEAYDLIGEHFENTPFPDILQTPLSEHRKDQQKRKIIGLYGVDLRILREGKSIAPSQEYALREAITEMQNRQLWGKMYKEDFRNAVELIQGITMEKGFTPEFFELLRQCTEFRKGSLERFTISSAPEPAIPTA